MTHSCVGKLTIVGSDNGLSPGWCQSIIWTNAGILLIGPLGANFREILIDIQTFSFIKMHLKISSAKWHPLCLGLNVLIHMLHNSLYMMHKNFFLKTTHANAFPWQSASSSITDGLRGLVYSPLRWLVVSVIPFTKLLRCCLLGQSVSIRNDDNKYQGIVNMTNIRKINF